MTRWDDLFGDIEGQFEAELAAEVDAEIADRTRREIALISLHQRLAATIGAAISVRVLGHGWTRGVLIGVGPDWLLLNAAADPSVAGREALIPLHAANSVDGLRRLAVEQGAVASRLSLAIALRAVARDRSQVLVALADGSDCLGRIESVGADFVELRTDAGGRSVLRLIPHSGLAYVKRA